MLKRTKHEKLGERIGIKLVKTWSVKGQPKLYGYRFEFPALMIKHGKTRRCYPGAQFYAASFAELDYDTAWKTAIKQFCKAVSP